MSDALIVISAAEVDAWPDDPDYRPGTAFNAMHVEAVSAIFSFGEGPVCVNCTDEIREVPEDQASEWPPGSDTRVIALSRRDPKSGWIHVKNGNVQCDETEDPGVWGADDSTDVLEHVAWPDPGLSSWVRSATLLAVDDVSELRLVVTLKNGAGPLEIVVRHEPDGSVSVMRPPG